MSDCVKPEMDSVINFGKCLHVSLHSNRLIGGLWSTTRSTITINIYQNNMSPIVIIDEIMIKRLDGTLEVS